MKLVTLLPYQRYVSFMRGILTLNIIIELFDLVDSNNPRYTKIEGNDFIIPYIIYSCR